MSGPTMSEHVCPYGANRFRRVSVVHGWSTVKQPQATTERLMQNCGSGGWLCHRCREDRADERAATMCNAANAVATWLENIAHLLQAR